MTEQEAMFCLKAESERYPEICNECQLYGEVGCDHCFDDAMDVAIKALEEVQQYRAIGTVEELKESKEQYDNINCAAKSVYLSGLCDFENAKGKIISEIKRNYEYSLMDYETIGTPKECRAAVEKQKAKKPDFEGDGYADGHLVYDTWICPCCGKHYEVDYDDYDFCPNCGQRLDWSEEE